MRLQGLTLFSLNSLKCRCFSLLKIHPHFFWKKRHFIVDFVFSLECIPYMVKLHSQKVPSVRVYAKIDLARLFSSNPT